MLSPNFALFPELTTPRLLLRELSLADAAAVKQIRSNAEVMKYINRPPILTIEAAEAWIKVILDAQQINNGITWCIAMKESPELHVGTIGFWRIDKENHRAEIGYMLESHLHGKGIMYEAIQAALDYGFTVMGLHSVEAQLAPENVASAALLRKAGFVQEGYFRENYYVEGRFADTAVYSLLASS